MTLPVATSAENEPIGGFVCAVPVEEPGLPGKLAVRLLGPFEVTVGGRPVVVVAGRLRSLLAVLAMSAGEKVSVDRLAAAVWGEELPGSTRRSVQTYVGRLRGDVPHELNVNAAWLPAQPIGESESAWARRFLAELKPYHAGVYLNFMDQDDTTRLDTAYTASAHQRLVELRHRYDPDHLFHPTR